MYKPNEYNDMFRAADLEDANPTANETAFTDYITYGTASALTSGVVGIMNSAKGLYNALGGETSYISEEQAIRESFGKDASNFYMQHKTGSDVVGFLASSMVAGVGALKAFRMAQASGRMTMGMEMATGLSNPTTDIVLGSRSMQLAKEVAVANPLTFSWNNAQTWNAIGMGLKQNMAEAFVFDAAAGIVNANNILINPDRQDYFTSLWNYTKDTVPFTVGFGFLGTAATGLQIRQGLKTAYAEKTLENTRFTLIGERLPQDGVAGDKLFYGFNALSALVHDPEYAVDAMDKFAVTRKAKAEEQVMTYLSDTFVKINKAGEEGLQFFERKVAEAKASRSSVEKLAEDVAGMLQLSHMSVRDFTSLDAFFSKTIAPTIHSVGKDLDNNFEILRAHLRQGFGPNYDMAVDGIVDSYKRMFQQDFLDLSSGISHKQQQEIIEKFKTTMDKLYESPLLQVPTAGASFVNKDAAYQHFLGSAHQQLKNFDTTLMNAGVLKKPLFGDTTFDEFVTMVSMHELSHFKTNGTRALNSVKFNVANNTEFGKEIEMFSRHLYPEDWEVFDEIVDNLIKKGVAPDKARRAAYTHETTREGAYALTPKELIAQAAEFMFHPQHMEAASKLAPKTAKFFERHGGVMKPWKETVAYKNVRTGEEYTSVLPLPQDLGKVVQSGDVIYVEGTRISTKYDTKFFNPSHAQEIYALKQDEYLVSTLDKAYNKAALMFAAIGKMKPDEFLKSVTTKTGDIILDQYDLPRLEKLVTSFTDETVRSDNINKRIMVNISETDIPKLVDMDIAEITKLLVDNKKKMSFAINNLREHNEFMIANALNIDVKAAIPMYQENKEVAGKMILMGERNYDRPEHIVSKYAPTKMGILDNRSRSLNSIMERESLLREYRMRGSAEILAESFALFPRPEAVTQLLPNLSEVESRTGMLAQLRAAVGKSGLRDMAQYVGRLTRNAKNAKSQEIEKAASPWYAIFNKPENVKLRSELALATNELYKGWYNTFKVVIDDGAEGQTIHALMSLNTVQRYTSVVEDLLTSAANGGSAAKKELAAKFGHIKNAGSLSPTDLGIILARGNSEGMQLSEHVFKYFDEYVKPFNQEVARNHSLIAASKGKTSVYRTDVIYPPPRDLKKFPYVAFVLPHAAIEGADAGRYMLFAKTAKELEIKTLAAKEKYGETHRIVTTGEVEEYKKLIGEHKPEDYFDEWFFDPELTRKGRTAEAIPNLDIQASEVLDRFRDWQHRTSESQIMSAVEMMYAPVTRALDSADVAFSRAANAAVTGRQERASIFADTKNIMLDKSSRMGNYGELYKRLSSRISMDGTKVIDGIVNKFGTQASDKMTEASFQQMNKEFEAAGFNPPHKDMVRALIASPDVSNSRSFELLVRTMNNLVGTFQLTLDMANSILQIIGSPVLTLPVIREAMRNSADARNLLTVVNPVTGAREPTPAKIFAKAIAASWTKEGKELREGMMQRGILTDYLKEYHEAQDFSSLTGRHSLKAVNDKIDQLREWGGKWSLHRYSEDLTRFIVAHSMQQIARARGLTEPETWAMIHNAVDATHGIYRAHQRAQVFNGIIGQSIGMYQTYFFTWAQNMLRNVAEGDTKRVMLQAGMQSSIFGLRSLPGFATFNAQIAATNSGQEDLYSVTNAEDPNSWGAWVMYGLGSHAFLYPADFASRGDITIRNALVLPTQIQDIPAVSILGKVIGNAVDTTKMIANGDASVGDALLFGLAHNGLSRPLQGLGTVISGNVTTNAGTPLFTNANHTDYDIANEVNLGMIATRIIGTRPLAEGIMMDNFYRNKGYLANTKKEVGEIGKEIRISLANDGEVTAEDWDDFSNRYVQAGGKIENFNAFVAQSLSAASKSEILEFRDHMSKDDPLSRNVGRMLIEREYVDPQEVQE